MDNIKKVLGEIGRGSMAWIGLTQDRDKWWGLENAVLKLQVP
jgi:hypothetical protein